MKRVHHNVKKCCISLYRQGNQYIFVRLLIKYLSILYLLCTKIRNLDKILDKTGDFGWTKNDILDNIFLVSLIMNVKSSADVVDWLNYSCWLHYVSCLSVCLSVCPVRAHNSRRKQKTVEKIKIGINVSQGMSKCNASFQLKGQRLRSPDIKHLSKIAAYLAYMFSYTY